MMIKILIVDDEELGRTVMEDIFGRYGKFVSVSNGNDAVMVFEKALERNQGFDLVLLDISLEDINGLEVLKKIKTIEKSQGKTKENQAVVFMVTAHGEKEIVIDSIKSGCQAYFIKPLKQESVDSKLSEFGFKPVS